VETLRRSFLLSDTVQAHLPRNPTQQVASIVGKEDLERHTAAEIGDRSTSHSVLGCVVWKNASNMNQSCTCRLSSEANSPSFCRGSIVAGVLVHGDLLITRTRMRGLPPATNPPVYSGRAVTARPVIEVAWLDATVDTVFASAVGLWNRYCKQMASLVHWCDLLPSVYWGCTFWGACLLLFCLQSQPTVLTDE
jgi:hypothetical protein